MKDNLAYKTDLETGTDNFCRLGAQVTPLTNIIYNEDCEETMKRLPDKSVSLIIADPPYYKIKGEFDWKWETFEEYLNWMETLAVEFKRILADNGSLFVYSHAKRVAYLQVRYDKYFTLENNITWNVMDMVAENQKHNDNLRSFPPITERLLFYSQDWDAILKQGETGIFEDIRIYLDKERVAAGLTKREINRMLGVSTNGGGMASHYFSEGNKIWELPTKEMYIKLQATGYFQKSYEELKQQYEELKQQYEELKQQYEELRRPFNNIKQLTDNWFFRRNRAENFDIVHETIKPLDMSKAIIATTTNEQDIVYIPFVGSGTECVAVNELNRKFIGSEINPKYVEIAEARIKGSRINYDLFYD